MLMLSTPCKAGQPLYGIELQEKDAKKKRMKHKGNIFRKNLPLI